MDVVEGNVSDVYLREPQERQALLRVLVNIKTKLYKVVLTKHICLPVNLHITTDESSLP